MSDTGTHVVCTGTFRLHAPLEKVFPMVTPEGERLWVPGWDPEWIHPPGGTLAAGAVFRTRHGGEETVWMILACDPAGGRVIYLRDTPGSRIGLVEVSLRESERVTEVTVTYRLTALSPDGRERLAAFAEHYEPMIAEWETGIAKVLAGEAP